jgi:hypothetical protein
MNTTLIGVSLLPELEQTLGASSRFCVEGDSVPVFSPGFIGEARIRAQHNLETSVEFLPRPRQRGLSLKCFWWITGSDYDRRKRAPFFSGVDTEGG